MGKLTTILLLFFFREMVPSKRKQKAVIPSDQYLVMKVPPCKAMRVNSLSKAEKMVLVENFYSSCFIHSSLLAKCWMYLLNVGVPSPPLDKNSIVPWDAYKRYFPVYHQTLFISTHERALLISCLQSLQTDFRFS